MLRFMTFWICALLLSAPAMAGNDGFATTTDEIVNALRGNSGWQGNSGDFFGEQSPDARVNVTINFDVGSATIRKDSYKMLRILGDALKNPALDDLSFVILGHTDSDGSEEANMDLSARRAKSVARFLVDNEHVDMEKLSWEGRGESDPLVANDTPAHKQMNRRVEIRVLR